MGISESQMRRGRRAAVAGMTDECEVRRKSGTRWDETVGKDVPSFTTVYDGVCELKSSEQLTMSAGGLTVEGYVLKLPVEGEPYQVGDEVLMRKARFEPSMAGRTLHVVKLGTGSHLMARRLQVKEVTGPSG